MTIQEIGVWAIFLCMLIAYLQKKPAASRCPYSDKVGGSHLDDFKGH